MPTQTNDHAARFRAETGFVKPRVAQLGDLCVMDRRGVHAGDSSVAELPFVGVENVARNTGVLNFDAGSRVGDRGSTAFLFDDRHVLYGKLRPYLNKVACPNFSGCCSTELIPLLPKEGVHRDFVAHLLRRGETVDFVMASVTGARMPRADMGALMSMEVPFPMFEDQRRIVGILNRVASIERLHTAAAEAASTLSRSLMAYLLEDRS